MSRSILQSKWMRKNYSNPYVSYTRRNMKDSHRNPHRLDEVSKNRPSRYITTHCKNQIHWLQESTSFGGHSIPKGGHRMVSGLVRAKVKIEIRKQIESELVWIHLKSVYNNNYGYWALPWLFVLVRRIFSINLDFSEIVAIFVALLLISQNYAE